MSKSVAWLVGAGLLTTLAACGGGGGGGGGAGDNPVAFPVTDGEVVTAVLSGDGGTLYIGGHFTEVGQPGGVLVARNNIAAVDTATGAVTGWNPNANDWVFTLAVDGSTVYAGGLFASIGGANRSRIAALDATSGLATTWNPNAVGYGEIVRAIAVAGDVVYVGGDFANVGGQPRNRIAALDSSTGDATSWDPDAGSAPSGLIQAFAVSGGTVYVGGTFTTIGGQARNNIAAIDAATGDPIPWGPGADGPVNDLAVDGSTLYVAGGFYSIGGQQRRSVAAFDTASGDVTSWNPSANNPVHVVAVAGGTVYVGGPFTSIGVQARNRIAAVDATTALATAWDPNADDRVSALAVSGKTVYAGGAFTMINDESRGSLAALTR